MADVFISYARGDRSFAQAMATELAAAGFSVWWDRELSAGQPPNSNINTLPSRTHPINQIAGPFSYCSMTFSDGAVICHASVKSGHRLVDTKLSKGTVVAHRRNFLLLLSESGRCDISDRKPIGL